MRHAITKLAHLHLTSTEKARERVIKLGEPEELVINTGCPGTDLIITDYSRSFSELRYALYKAANNRPEVLEKFQENYFLVMQSPVTTEVNEAENQIDQTLEALKAFSELKIILLPNPDAGGDKMEKKILEFGRDRQDVLIFKHFPPDIFVDLMKKARVMVGNSSAGIREAGYFGLPVVNIGTRQAGRERTTNIIDVGNEKDEIIRAIETQLTHGPYSKETLYGTGGSAEKIADLLASVDFTKIQKQLTY
jgi:UDP-hydrolysing UDP-N-acetyl-D-glucosamine 2-epimerase